MRRIIRLVVLLALLFVPLSAFAQQPKTVGIGIILGQPTGLSVKYWINNTSAIDVAAAWQFLPTGTAYVHADYLYQIYNLFPVKQGKLPLYFGIGGSVTIQANPTIGIRVPVGIEYLFPDAPLDLFVEIAGGMSLFPATRFQGSGGIGLRYDF